MEGYKKFLSEKQQVVIQQKNNVGFAIGARKAKIANGAALLKSIKNFMKEQNRNGESTRQMRRVYEEKKQEMVTDMTTLKALKAMYTAANEEIWFYGLAIKDEK